MTESRAGSERRDLLHSDWLAGYRHSDSLASGVDLFQVTSRTNHGVSPWDVILFLASF